MQNNFGARWEGQTRWFTPSDDASSLAAVSEPLDAVYQLEFPRDTPELGTWRGWGVLAPGDGPRVVPLSEASVIERQRQQGSTTFQFPGVGGRCSLRCDGEVLAVEVNFFHGGQRSGLVAYLKAPNDSSATAGDASVSLMAMSFRRARISDDGNATFVDGPAPTLKPQHTLASLPPASAGLGSVPPGGAAPTRARREWMLAEDYAIRAVGGDGTAPPLPPASSASVLELCLPDGVRCWLPRAWPLTSDARLVFSCDFRGAGGPFRSVAIEYCRGGLERWVCEDREG